MTWIKRYSILFLLLIAGILFSLVHVLDAKRGKSEENEVIKFNELRREYGVPVIENGWNKESAGPKFPPSRSKELSNESVDSVLRSWNMKIN